MSPPHSLPPLQSPFPPPPVDLDNCAREPIHIPGFVQPHGVLLAIEGDGRLTHASRNARAVLARLPPLGTPVDAQELTGDSALAAALASARHDAARGSDGGPTATEITLDGAMHLSHRRDRAGTRTPAGRARARPARPAELDQHGRAADPRRQRRPGDRASHQRLGRAHEPARPLRRAHSPAARSAEGSPVSRLISQVLDMSRLHGGLGLGIHIERGDLAALIRGLVDEAALAYPAMVLRTELPETLDVDMDHDRMSQVIVNLISNARQHGVIGEAIDIRLAATPPNAVMSLSNVAKPIAIEAVARLFDPLKHGAVGNQRNPDGLGLGLYIASEVVKGHRGAIGYEHDGERVFFTVSLPLRRAA